MKFAKNKHRDGFTDMAKTIIIIFFTVWVTLITFSGSVKSKKPGKDKRNIPDHQFSKKNFPKFLFPKNFLPKGYFPKRLYFFKSEDT